MSRRGKGDFGSIMIVSFFLDQVFQIYKSFKNFKKNIKPGPKTKQKCIFGVFGQGFQNTKPGQKKFP